MFKQRNILYLTDYIFKDNKIQNIYIIILEVLENDIICLVKTTTKQYVNDFDITPGCIKNENSNAYYIPNSKIIGESNFSFPSHTFIYFNSTIKYKNISEIETNCKKIEFKDTMLKKEFNEIIYCSIHSSYLKPYIIQRFEKYLENNLN